MRQVIKRIGGLLVLLGILLYRNVRLAAYCKGEMKYLAKGGQSTIYQCDDKIVKFYRRPWRVDMAEMTTKLEALNKLYFVPKTTEFFYSGFKQELIAGTHDFSMTLDESYQFGNYLAQIHSLKLNGIKQFNSCHSNTVQIYNHLTVSSLTWFVKCSQTDGNPKPNRTVLNELNLSRRIVFNWFNSD